MITVTSAHHRCLVYHILLVALEVFPWSEELASRPFHGWLCSRLERFLAVVDSSSVLLDGPSKPCIPHLELELELELTWLSIPPAPGVNTLSTVSPVILGNRVIELIEVLMVIVLAVSSPCVRPVLVLVVVVRV